MQEIKTILKIVNSNNKEDLRALYGFNTDSEDVIVMKFNLWAKRYFTKYFTFEDAEFHKEIDLYNCRCYLQEFTFIDIAFRGAAKTARTKLFIAYCIANDIIHRRKYIKILSQDGNNAKQIVTDI